MDKKNIILIVIAVLIIALIAVAAFIYTGETAQKDITEVVNNTTQTVLNADNVNTTNDTVVGDNSTRVNETGNGTNQTYKVYNPQSDSYVDVIGEKYDADVNRWYTYDTDGVRYYNTRIN